MNPRVIGACIVVAVTLLVFAQVVRFDFVDWDDWAMVAENPDVISPSLRTALHYWTTPHMGLYVPLSYNTYMAVASASRAAHSPMSPNWFHAANLLLHLGACLCAYEILYRLFASVPSAVLGALIFAIHPVQVEPVSWIASLNTILSGTLATLALLLYVIYAQRARDQRPSIFWAIVATFVAASAMLAKPSALVLPLLAGIIDIGLIRRNPKALLIPAIWLAIAIPLVIVGRAAQSAPSIYSSPLWARPMIALDTIAFYVWKTLWPAHLGVDYGRSPQWLLASRTIYLTWLIPVALILAAWFFRKRAPFAIIGLAFLIASIAPVLGLITFDFQIYSTVADRYLYLGMLGVSITVAGFLTTKPQTSILSVIIALLAMRAAFQVQTWRDTPHLLNNALATNPRSTAGVKILAFALARAQQYPQAVEQYHRALQLTPDDTTLQLNLANVLTRMGNLDDALKLYAHLAVARAWDERVAHNYGAALMLAGDIPRAGAQFKRATELAPDNSQAQTALGKWYEINHNLPAAQHCYLKAIEADPNNTIAQAALNRVRTMSQ